MVNQTLGNVLQRGGPFGAGGGGKLPAGGLGTVGQVIAVGADVNIWCGLRAHGHILAPQRALGWPVVNYRLDKV